MEFDRIRNRASSTEERTVRRGSKPRSSSDSALHIACRARQPARHLDRGRAGRCKISSQSSITDPRATNALLRRSSMTQPRRHNEIGVEGRGGSRNRGTTTKSALRAEVVRNAVYLDQLIFEGGRCWDGSGFRRCVLGRGRFATLLSSLGGYSTSDPRAPSTSFRSAGATNAAQTTRGGLEVEGYVPGGRTSAVWRSKDTCKANETQEARGPHGSRVRV